MSNKVVQLPCGDIVTEPPFPDSIRRYGAANVETALIMIQEMVDPRTGLAISLTSDDEGLLAVLEGAFEATVRDQLNSEGWEEKLADAIETVRYSFKLPIILLPTESRIRVVENNGDVAFEGSDWDFVRWVRDTETIMIDMQERADDILAEDVPVG